MNRHSRCANLLAAIFLVCPLPTAQSESGSTEKAVLPNDPRIQIVGRYDARDPEHPRFAYPASGFQIRFQGTGIRLEMSSDSEQSALTLVMDHGAPTLQLLKKGINEFETAGQTNEGPHTLEVYKRTETWQGVVTLLGIRLPSDAALLPAPPLPARKLMFIGDSVTCGAGIDNNDQCNVDPERPANDAYDSYGMQLGRRLDAQTYLVCYGGRGLERDYRGLGESDGVLNAPEFFRLAIPTDEPISRAPWDASRWRPDAIFVSLGTNDFNLQKTKPLDEKKWVREYVTFIRAMRKDYRHAFLVLTEGAIVTDPLLSQMVQQAATAAHDKKVKYVPSQHYRGNGCDAHPTRLEHQRMADDFETVLRHTLGW